IAACEPILADLQTIKTHAQRTAEMIGSELVPGRAGEDASKTLNHDLRNCLTLVLGFGGELGRLAHKYFLDDFADEFREGHSLGRRILCLVDATVAQLRPPGGYAAVADIDRYLDRIASPDADRDDALAPSADPGRILIAEDTEPVRNLLCEYLRSQGHQA